MSTRRVICRKMQRDLDVTVCLLFVTTEFRIRVTGRRDLQGSGNFGIRNGHSTGRFHFLLCGNVLFLSC